MNLRRKTRAFIEWFALGRRTTASRRELWLVLLLVLTITVSYILFIFPWVDEQLYHFLRSSDESTSSAADYMWGGYVRDILCTLIALPMEVFLSWVLLLVASRRAYTIGFRTWPLLWLILSPVAAWALRPVVDVCLFLASTNADGSVNEQASFALTKGLHCLRQLCTLVPVVCCNTLLLVYLFPLGFLRTCSHRNSRLFRRGLVVVLVVLTTVVAMMLRW